MLILVLSQVQSKSYNTKNEKEDTLDIPPPSKFIRQAPYKCFQSPLLSFPQNIITVSQGKKGTISLHLCIVGVVNVCNAMSHIQNLSRGQKPQDPFIHLRPVIQTPKVVYTQMRTTSQQPPSALSHRADPKCSCIPMRPSEALALVQHLNSLRAICS